MKKCLTLLLMCLSVTTITFAQEATILNKLLPDFSKKQPNIGVDIDKSSQLKQPLEDVIINSIFVEGNIFLSDEAIIESSKLAINQSLNELLINRAKKNIKKTGVVKNVTIVFDETSRNVTIYVDENPIVTDIIFEGNTIYTTSYLNAFLESKVDTPLNLNKLKRDIQFVSDQYDKDGYIEAKVVQVIKPESVSGPLRFVIAEGVISDIEITGNIKTKDYVILREIDLRPGDVINQENLRKNIRKVFNLNYFNNVIPELLPSGSDYHYILKLTIVEKETSGAFTFGGGYQPNNGFNVFSDLYWDNLQGTGQLIMLKGNFGLGAGGYDNQNNTYQIKYHNPWAFGERKSFTFRLWSSSGSFSFLNIADSSYSFNDTSRRGFDMEFGIPLSYDFRTSHRVMYESVTYNDLGTHYNLYTYTIKAIHDKRDQIANPTEGFYNTYSIEQGFKFRPEALDLTRFDIVLSKYFSFFKKQVLFMKSTFGIIRSPSIDNETIFNDEFYVVGGSRTVRGYEDGSPFAYGDKQLIGTMEYRYIFTPDITSYLFVDVGYATKFKVSEGVYETKDINDFSSYKLTKGIGVKFVIAPVGPIRLDFGITEESIGRLQFNMGYSF